MLSMKGGDKVIIGVIIVMFLSKMMKAIRETKGNDRGRARTCDPLRKQEPSVLD